MCEGIFLRWTLNINKTQQIYNKKVIEYSSATLSRITFSITKLSIMGFIATLSINDTHHDNSQHNATNQYYADGHIRTVILIVVMRLGTFWHLVSLLIVIFPHRVVDLNWGTFLGALTTLATVLPLKSK